MPEPKYLQAQAYCRDGNGTGQRNLMSHIQYDQQRAALNPDHGVGQKPSTSLARGLLTLAMVALLFANLNGYIVTAQVLAFAFLSTSVVTCIVRGHFSAYGLSYFEFSVALSTILSLVMSIISDQTYSGLYTVVFAFTCISAGIVARSLTDKEILNSAARAYVVMVVLVVFYHAAPITTALDMRSLDRWMIRLRPFGMHPNLTGFVFGAGVAILAYSAATRSGLARAIYGLACLGSLAIVLAASARASLLALIISAILIYAFNFINLPRSVRIVSFALGVMPLTMILFYPPFIQYIITVLELDSNTRGISSGGSGRIELWQKGIDYIVSNPETMFFGDGLRSASADRIGFFTESSYINILIESGFFVGGLLIFSLLGSAFRFPVEGKKSDIVKLTITWVIAFALVQSVFNRYLLGIGNTFSLILMILYAAAWCKLNEAKILRIHINK